MSSGPAAPIRLALLAASPIHYHVPLYRRLAASPELDLTVIFASDVGVRAYDVGYGRPTSWDVDLLQGYRSVFLRRFRKNKIGGGFFSLRDFDIIRELLKGQHEVLWLHGYNYLTHQLAAVIQEVRGLPVLYREEQTLLETRSWWKRTAKRLILPTRFHHTYALFIGSRNRSWFWNYGASDRRMFFVPYAVDNERLAADYARLRCDRERLRLRFGIAPDTGPVILGVARMIEKKQPMFLLEAFRMLRRTHRCNLLLVGSGPLETNIREKVAREGIPDVHLAGFLNQSEISLAYATADVFTLVSRAHETWGLVINEAMNFSLPIVVSAKVGCAIDLVADGENGFVVDSEDATDLSGSLEMLVRYPALRQQFGEASRNRISGWTYDVAMRGALQAVKAAVGNGRWQAASPIATTPAPELVGHTNKV